MKEKREIKVQTKDKLKKEKKQKQKTHEYHKIMKKFKALVVDDLGSGSYLFYYHFFEKKVLTRPVIFLEFNLFRHY